MLSGKLIFLNETNFIYLVSLVEKGTRKKKDVILGALILENILIKLAWHKYQGSIY